MSVNLITGYAGTAHITAAGDGAVNAGMFGNGKYVLNIGERFNYEIISNNLIRVKSGYAIDQGRKIELAVNDYEEIEIDNGLQGVKRCDLIVMHYEKSLTTGIETATMKVIKGISGDEYTDPAYISGNILNGANEDDFLLYRVKINGLNIETVEQIFTVTNSILELLEEKEKEIDELQEDIGNLKKKNTSQDEKITSINESLTQLNTNLNNKQDKLTNPLTQSDVVNNLTSTATNKPLSANQGKILKTYIDSMTSSPAWSELATGIVKMSITKKTTGDVNIVCSSAPGVGISANTWTTINNLSDKYRPALNIPFTGNYGAVMFIGYVYTNGNIVIYSPTAITTSGNAICFNINYPV
ncbi:MAG: hypothetical protein MRZ75_02280 [Roseburia sp.]|nr:hypothetical protein [Roseburia sp.]